MAKIARMLKTGVPSGVQMFMDIGSFTVFIALIGRMGNVQLAANQAALQIVFFGFCACHAFSVATTSLVGQYIGAEQPEIAMKSARTAVHMLTYYLLAVLLVVAVFPADLIAMFADDERVIVSGALILHLAMIFLVFDGMGVVAAGALRGAGDTRWPMAVTIVAGWGFFLPMAYAFGEIFHGGLFGAWIGATIYIFTLSTLLWTRFHRGRWKTLRI